MQAKQELTAIKNLDEKSKIIELNVANLLENNWEQYYLCQIFKENNGADIDLQGQCFFLLRWLFQTHRIIMCLLIQMVI